MPKTRDKYIPITRLIIDEIYDLINLDPCGRVEGVCPVRLLELHKNGVVSLGRLEASYKHYGYIWGLSAYGDTWSLRYRN